MSRLTPFDPDRKKLTDTVNIGPINQMPIDRFGNVIREGSTVMFRPEVDLVYQVVGVRPVMDPRAPPGLVDVQLQVAPFVLRVPARQPQLRLTALSGAPSPVDTTPVVPEEVTGDD